MKTNHAFLLGIHAGAILMATPIAWETRHARTVTGELIGFYVLAILAGLVFYSLHSLTECPECRMRGETRDEQT